MAWSELVHSAVCSVLNLRDDDERERPFYREVSEEKEAAIRDVIERLVGCSIWARPHNDEVDGVLADSKSKVKSWLRDHGLTSGYLLGAPD